MLGRRLSQAKLLLVNAVVVAHVATEDEGGKVETFFVELDTASTVEKVRVVVVNAVAIASLVLEEMMLKLNSSLLYFPQFPQWRK